MYSLQLRHLQGKTASEMVIIQSVLLHTMDSQLMNDASGTAQQLEQGVASISKQLSKMEKFLNNVAALQQKGMQRLETIETEHTKMTLKYNGLREDYKRLITEEVQMRTARNKGEFISLDDLEAVKSSISELENGLKKKLDSEAYRSQTEKREAEQKQIQTQLNQNIQNVRVQSQNSITALRKADTQMNSWIQKFRQDIMKRVDDAKIRVQKQLSQVKEPIDKINAELESVNLKLENLQSNTDAKICTLQKHIKRKTQEIMNQFLDFQRKYSETDKTFKDEINIDFQIINNKIDGMAGKALQNSEKQLRQISDLRVGFAMNEELCKNLEAKIQQEHNIVDSQISMLRDLNNTEHSQVLADIASLKQRLEMFKLDQIKISEKAQQQALQDKKNQLLSGGGGQSLRNNLAEDSPRFNAYDSQSQNQNHNSPRKRSGTVDQFKKQNTEKVARTSDGDTTPFGGISRHSIALTKEYESSMINLQAAHSALRIRMNDIETSTNILREMIESKVNQSEVIKLQDNKCNKHSFNDLVAKLEIFKSLVEKVLPDCQGLKQITFDDTGVFYSTLSRLTAIKTKQRNREESNSKSKQRDKDISCELASDKKTPMGSKLPIVLNKSRKRYLTFFDRSMSHTVHQARHLPLKS